MARLLDVLLGRTRTLAEELWEKCGGPGSRRPGPCPSAVKPQPAQPVQPASQEAAPQPDVVAQPTMSAEAMDKAKKQVKAANKATKNGQLSDKKIAKLDRLGVLKEISRFGQAWLKIAGDGFTHMVNVGNTEHPAWRETPEWQYIANEFSKNPYQQKLLKKYYEESEKSGD